MSNKVTDKKRNRSCLNSNQEKCFQDLNSNGILLTAKFQNKKKEKVYITIKQAKRFARNECTEIF